MKGHPHPEPQIRTPKTEPGSGGMRLGRSSWRAGLGWTLVVFKLRSTLWGMSQTYLETPASSTEQGDSEPTLRCPVTARGSLGWRCPSPLQGLGLGPGTAPPRQRARCLEH